MTARCVVCDGKVEGNYLFYCGKPCREAANTLKRGAEAFLSRGGSAMSALNHILRAGGVRDVVEAMDESERRNLGSQVLSAVMAVEGIPGRLVRPGYQVTERGFAAARETRVSSHVAAIFRTPSMMVAELTESEARRAAYPIGVDTRFVSLGEYSRRMGGVKVLLTGADDATERPRGWLFGDGSALVVTDAGWREAQVDSERGTWEVMNGSYRESAPRSEGGES